MSPEKELAVEYLNEAIVRIKTDRETFKRCGRNELGHMRSTMLIEEMIEEIKEDDEKQVDTARSVQ
jgi:hypothetical protein